jgi:hypothetical protein
MHEQKYYCLPLNLYCYSLCTIQISPNSTTNLVLQHKSLELLKVGRSQSGHGIPANGGIPRRPWDDAGTLDGCSALRADTIAADALAEGDVVQGARTDGVEQRVEEAERGLASAEARVVEKTDDACNDWRSGRRSSRWRELTTVYDLIAGVCVRCKYGIEGFGDDLLGRHAVGTDIRESSASEVRERLIVLLDSGADVGLQVRLDCSFLVDWAREVVAEPTSAANPSLLWADGHSSSDGRDVRAGSWELGGELRGLVAVVALAGRADSIVAGRFEH